MSPTKIVCLAVWIPVGIAGAEFWALEKREPIRFFVLKTLVLAAVVIGMVAFWPVMVPWYARAHRRLKRERACTALAGDER